ncbi:hypothetical protein TNCV_3405781 [Trichonephila clavipes]|nr:hypothetical protein TNCV_3405781 [Trichonephila clavipes]
MSHLQRAAVKLSNVDRSAAIERLRSTAIEHLRDLLERRIRQHNISGKNMLKSVLKDEWEKISAEEIIRLINSMLK